MKWQWFPLLLAGCASLEPGPEPVLLTPVAVHARQERGDAVVPVCACNPAKCGGTHLAGTVTLESLERREPKTAELILFYCGCPGDEMALALAREHPDLNVAVLEGGITAWIAAGYPVERAPLPPQAADEGLPWIDDLESAERASRQTGRPLVVCYVAAWCDVCRRFRKRTLAAPAIVELKDRFTWALVDLDRDPAPIRERRLRGTPTTDLVDPSGVTRARISGSMPPDEFRRHLEEFEAEVARGAAPPPDRREIESAAGREPSDLPRGFRADGMCFSNVGYGPLRLPSLSPFQSLRHLMTPRTPSTLGEGRFEVQWTESWANVWALNNGDHLLDYESLHTSLSLAYGVTDGVQFEIGFLQKSRFGGVMDGFIEEFHDLFGLAQGGREKFERNNFAVHINDDEGETVVELTNRDRGSFSESIVATVQHNLTCGTRSMPAVAYAVSVRRELGDQEDMTKAEVADVTLSLSVSKRFGDLFAYVGLGYSWFGEEKFGEIELRNTQYSILAAVEWQLTGRASLLAQCLITEGVARNFGEFSDPSFEVTFGGKFEVVPRVVLEAGLIENVVTFDNSPDFGVHVGVLFRP